MKNMQVIAMIFSALIVAAGAEIDLGRKLLQTVRAGTPPTITVSASNPNVNAITITLAIPYPQNAYFCNVTGDSRLPQQGPFPITVRVPVGVTSTVIFANITGPIPGTTCQMGTTVVQQTGTPASVVQQSSTPTSIQQMINNPTSVLQQTGSGTTVVQQQYATSVNQQNSSISSFMSCVGNASSVVQQQAPPATVVQQSTPAPTPKQPPTTVVQQPSPPTTVVQQSTPATTPKQPPTTVVQQPSPPTTVVQQSTPATTPTVQKPSPPTTVVQQSTPATTPTAQKPSPPTTVVQQSTPATTPTVQTPSPPTTVVQQSTPATIVQQGRKLLQAGTIEFISNNGSTGQPQLTVLDTTEGVPNISFRPTAAGQTAQFNGALQVAKTTTNDGFGTPYIPYQVDSRLSPQCGVQVNFVGF